MKIFPSLVSADLLQLGCVIQEIDEHVDGYHLDIMDDHFVPNLTWGPAFIAALRRCTKKPFQIHLMVDNPDKWIDRLAFNPGDSFVFHVEAVADSLIHTVVRDARSAGWRVGLALNPGTEVARVGQHLAALDELLLMSVNPGFSGQSFIDTSSKIADLRIMGGRLEVKTPMVCMDGGINAGNIGHVARAGVELIGAAASVFGGDDLVGNIKKLREAAQ